MATYKRSVYTLIMLALLFILTSGVSVFAPDEIFVRFLPGILLMVMALFLLFHFSGKIIDKEIRHSLMAVAGMIIFWILLRTAKYVAFEETQIVARHIWYLYYIPILAIPQISLYTALSAGEQAHKGLPVPFYATCVCTAAFILLVLTNDLHQWMFRFRPGFADWDHTYDRTGIFWMVYAWAFLMFVAVFGILFAKCRLSESRRLIWVPMIPVIFGVAYMILYSMDRWPRINGHLFGEFPEAVCYMVAGMWMELMNIGFIPSNEGYGELFDDADLAAQIADRDFHVIYRSRRAANLTAQQMQSDQPVMLDDKTRLHRKAVRGGFVFWQDDMEELQSIYARLEETGQRLAEETEFLRLENELREQRAQIVARSQVYDRIAEAVLPQSARIELICRRAETDVLSDRRDVAEICLLGVYIKRYANLALMASEQRRISTEELYLSIRESLNQLEGLGIAADVFLEETTRLASQEILAVYGLFEALVEQALPDMQGIRAVLTKSEMKLIVEQAVVKLPADSSAELSVEDGVSYITRRFMKPDDSERKDAVPDDRQPDDTGDGEAGAAI